MRVIPPSDDATAQLAAFIPYGLLGYLIALICLLVALVRARRRLVPAVLTVTVAVLTACHAAWLAPLFVDDHRAAATAKFPEQQQLPPSAHLAVRKTAPGDRCRPQPGPREGRTGGTRRIARLCGPGRTEPFTVLACRLWIAVTH